jgi:hypothetical protein
VHRMGLIAVVATALVAGSSTAAAADLVHPPLNLAIDSATVDRGGNLQIGVSLDCAAAPSGYASWSKGFISATQRKGSKFTNAGSFFYVQCDQTRREHFTMSFLDNTRSGPFRPGSATFWASGYGAWWDFVNETGASSEDETVQETLAVKPAF